MTNDKILSYQLSHIRHELSNPINSIIGYSELILEILEEPEELEIVTQHLPENNRSQKQHQLMSGLQLIQEKGVKILNQIKTIFALEEEENCLSLTERFQQFQEKNTDYLTEILETCQFLLSFTLEETSQDLQKIMQGSQRLQEMIQSPSDWLELSEAERLTPETAVPKWLEQKPDKTASDAFPFFHSSDSFSGRILVVDDNENNRELLSRRIQDQNYVVTTVADGKEAIKAIKNQEYDLILLDILMPEIDGYQVLSWLKQSQWKDIPVIMISALDELESVVKCIEMGAEDYLQKPFESTLLKARVNTCLEKKKLRDQETLYLKKIASANEKITLLNDKLKAENLRMSAELNIAKKIQQMVLPKLTEIRKIKNLDISGYMESTDEVGGDYYDIICHQGQIKMGIGDVTGHGLESGVLMLMLQTAIRTLTEIQQVKTITPVEFLTVLNRTIYYNIERMGLDRHLTLTLLDYEDGKITISGQHEQIILVRKSGKVEIVDTSLLGFYIGLELDVNEFFDFDKVQMQIDDVMVLYTDGITEAENREEKLYGIQKICDIVNLNRHLTAQEIRDKVIEDLKLYIGDYKIFDDITLLVIKRKE